MSKRRSISHNRSQLKHLSRAIVLEELQVPGMTRTISLSIIATVVGFGVWASVASIDEVARATGEIAPSGSIQTIQHLEGGIVSEILVTDGQLVEQGQPILRLEPTAAHAEFARLKSRETSLLLRLERLRAYSEGRDADFSFASAGQRELVRDQSSILSMQKRVHNSRRRVQETLIAQRKAELEQLYAQEETATKQLGLVQEETGMRRELLQKGLASKLVFLDSQGRLTQVRGDLNAISEQINRNKQAISESENRLLEIEAEARNDAFNEIGQLSAELAELREGMRQQQDRLQRLEISAPARGMIQGMQINTIGAVIGSGQELLDLIPMDAALVAEVKLEPRHIGHVEEGQNARVSITTFDVMRHGTLEGTVHSISPTTFQDEKIGAYYKVILNLNKSFVGANPELNQILPGMTVQADIVTGSKTVMTYLMKPIHRALNSSFSER